MAQIDSDLQLAQGTAAKKLKVLRKKAPRLIKLVRRLEHIHFLENLLDRKKHLEGIRRIQIEAKEAGGWLYGRGKSGFWLDKDKMKLEPIESEVISQSGDRVLAGETVYSIAKTAGYDHRTLRDILKDPYNKQGGNHPGIFSEEKHSRIQGMLRRPPKGGVGWGFKRFGSEKLVNDAEVDDVHHLADLRIKEWSSNRIAAEFGWKPEIVVAKLNRLHDPAYQEILGTKWATFTDADNRIKADRLSTQQGRK